MTKASELQGLSIDKWGFSYFDVIYYFNDPRDVPMSYSEAYSNSTVGIHVRVRSDGWILAWTDKDDSLSLIVMSGLSITSEVGTSDPWIKYRVTALSYTIYKTLVQVGEASTDDTNDDGVPDDLVTISSRVGYYDYKYCGVEGKYGFLAVIGARVQTSKSGYYGDGWSYTASKLFDFLVGNAYTINNTVLSVNAYMYFYSEDGTLSVAERVYFDTTSTPSNTVFEKAKSGSSSGTYIYIVR